MLKELLSKLGASTRITVGISVSPNVGLEMIEVDSNTGTVVKYSCRPLEYNTSLREITSYERFRIALEEMFSELDISPKSNVVLSLPNVYFGTITLPVLLPDEAITNAIISEVEQSYVFKRAEPVISWSDVSVNTSSDTRFIAYSAIQKTSIDSVMEIFDEIGCKVISIENSYNSLFRALSFLKVTELQMQDNISWNIMIVMQNSYSIISMVGNKPVDYFEEPLALKTFVDEEIYNAIKTSAQMTLMGLPANYLVIVSETDLVSAEVLSLKLPFDGAVSFLECNKFSQKDLIPISLDILQNRASLITAGVVGAGICTFYKYPLKLNFVQKDAESNFEDSAQEYPKINIGNLEVELTPTFIKKFSLIIAFTILLPLLGLMMTLNNVIIPKENLKLTEIENQIEKQEAKISNFKKMNLNVTFDIYSSIDSNIKLNKKKMFYYRALEYSIPDGLWLTYYEANNQGEINIKGATVSTEKIYEFYKNLKQLINNSNIALKRLELSENSLDMLAFSSPVDGNFYQFEITDMTGLPTTTANNPENPDEQNPNNPTNPNLDKNNSENIQTETRKTLFELGQSGNSSDSNITKPDNLNSDIPKTIENSRGTPYMPPRMPEMNRRNNNGLPENLQKIENFGGN